MSEGMFVKSTKIVEASRDGTITCMLVQKGGGVLGGL